MAYEWDEPSAGLRNWITAQTSAPAAVDAKITSAVATQHVADNASYAPLSAVSIHPFLLMG